jgi:hypothetical protein
VQGRFWGALLGLFAAANQDAVAQGAAERPITLAAEPAPLHGTLLLPPCSDRSLTAALILAGSGPVDRDDNLPGARSEKLKLLAQGLTARGIGTLRVDKRAIGASRAAARREEDLRFETYVSDAVRWLEVLRAEPCVAKVALIGHSEGALVATLTAQRVPDLSGLVAIAGAGVPAGAVMRRQFGAAGLPPELRDEADRILTGLENGRTVADTPPQLAALFRPRVQPYLMSWLGLDPAAEIAKVRAPVLVIQGTTDFQVTTDDARRLAAARSEAKLVVIESMNHILKKAPLDRKANLATYADPTRPVMPELVEAIARFLRP